MKLIKCPRCELNYMLDTEKYCKVCMRDIKGDKQQEEIELCSVCNEAPVLPGRDVCLLCLKEMGGDVQKDGNGEQEDAVDTNTLSMLDSVATMDEIIPEIQDDEEDMKRIGEEMKSDKSLEEMAEDEQNERFDDEEEEE